MPVATLPIEKFFHSGKPVCSSSSHSP